MIYLKSVVAIVICMATLGGSFYALSQFSECSNVCWIESFLYVLVFVVTNVIVMAAAFYWVKGYRS